MSADGDASRPSLGSLPRPRTLCPSLNRIDLSPSPRRPRRTRLFASWLGHVLRLLVSFSQGRQIVPRRKREQASRRRTPPMTELRWFDAVPPRNTTLNEVTALVRVLVGRPHVGFRQLQPIIVFELWLHPDRVRWLIGIEERIARTLSGQLISQLPGLMLMPTASPERPQPITAREVRFTSLSYPLRLDTASAVTSGLLHVRSELRAGEAVVCQWVVGPSHHYIRRPQEQTPLDLLGFTTPRAPDGGDQQAWRQKQAEPLFGVRGRLGAVASEPRWAGALLRPVVAALSLANGTQARMPGPPQSSRTTAPL